MYFHIGETRRILNKLTTHIYVKDSQEQVEKLINKIKLKVIMLWIRSEPVKGGGHFQKSEMLVLKCLTNKKQMQQTTQINS